MLAPDSADTRNTVEDSRLNDLTVVVPVRNAEDIIDDCLASIARACPDRVIVVDGMSTDRTLEIARRYPVTILSDKGAGLPAARLLGARTATTRHVALIDADVVLHDGALERLLDEFLDGGYTALQAGLHSVSGDGYWGQALAHHHRSGRSKNWFGLVATIFERDVLLRHGFDDRFKSGEDIDLRWRLQAAGAKLGVSRRTVVQHRFGDTWDFAKGQWLADGHGLGRMVAAHGLRAKLLIGLPLAACLRGTVLSLVRRQPQWLPYYLCYAAYNYVAMLRELRQRVFRRTTRAVASAEA
jgi:glycosyltransferase involved in cell wall biosynthesis